MKLDAKYQDMFEEFLRLRKHHKKLKGDLVDRLQIIRTDFEEWKSKEPRVVKIIEERQPIYYNNPTTEVVKVEAPIIKQRQPLISSSSEAIPVPRVKKEKKVKRLEQEIVEPLSRKTVTTTLVTTPRSSTSLNSSNRSVELGNYYYFRLLRVYETFI